MLTLRRDKLLVCVSEQRASAALSRAGRIVELESFAHNEDGLASFREFMARHAATPVSMVVDASEEDYRAEALPHTRGTERKEIVARKLKQHYRNTPYAGAWLQDREKGKRREDRFLFAALTDPDLLTDWLRVLQGHALPLSGLYLLPTVSAGLAAKLHIRTRNLAIAAHHDERLRITFLREGQLKFSRVTRTDNREADQVRFFAGEISNTRLYLHALRMATLDERLTILLLDPQDALRDVADTIMRDNPALRCLRLDAAQLEAKLRIGRQYLAASPDALYLQLLALHRGDGCIAPADATAQYRLYRTRRALYAACAGMGALAACGTGLNGWLTHGVRTQVHAVESQIGAYQNRYERLAANAAGAPVSGDVMKRAVDVAQRLRDNARNPGAMMAVLSQALESSPEIVLHEFGWTHATSDIQKGRDAGPVASNALPGTSSTARKQSAYVAGQIKPFRGDYRAAITSINRFAESLRKVPAVAEVRILRMPLNISPSATLSGTTLDKTEGTATAEFDLVIVYKPRI